MIWEHEVYFDFDYRVDCEFFHSFESDDNEQIGFLFADEDEATHFAQVVISKSEILQISQGKSTGGEGSVRSTESGGTGGGGFFSLFRRSKRESKTDPSDSPHSRKPHELTADDVGDPYDFQHLAHIGFDRTTGAFNTQNIPAEWREIFDKAGVTDEQLRNKETAGFIVDFVRSAPRVPSKQSGVGRSPAKKGPPPPPPAKNFKAAPQVPPRRPAVSQDAIPARTIPEPVEVKVEEESNDSSTIPRNVDQGRAQLLASIRGANNAQLRHVDQNDIPESPQPVEEQSDIMANMLAKALASRNRKLAHSDSDDSGDEW